MRRHRSRAGPDSAAQYYCSITVATAHEKSTSLCVPAARRNCGNTGNSAHLISNTLNCLCFSGAGPGHACTKPDSPAASAFTLDNIFGTCVSLAHGTWFRPPILRRVPPARPGITAQRRQTCIPCRGRCRAAPNFHYGAISVPLGQDLRAVPLNCGGSSRACVRCMCLAAEDTRRRTIPDANCTFSAVQFLPWIRASCAAPLRFARSRSP